MKASFFRRLGAYIIDIFIIMIVSSLISGFLPNNQKITNLNEENLNLLTDYYEVVSEGNQEKVKEYSNKINDFSYELSRLSVYSDLVMIGLYLLYFIAFQGYNNGQTVGKKILKIEVVDAEDNNITFKQLFLRSVFIYPIVLALLQIILIFVLNKSTYLTFSTIISYLQYGIYLVCFITTIVSGRGLHDKFAGTKVINFGTVENVEESKVSKWKKTAEKEKSVSSYKLNHTRGKRKE